MEQQRRRIIETEIDAAARVHDGMTVAIGGFINAAHPMALIRQIIRNGTKDLVVVGAASAGLEIDLLIAAGCVRRVIAPYIGGEGLAPIGPAFQAAAQAGSLEVYEIDEAMYYAGLRASAQGLPFNPWRAGVGTSYPKVNPALKEFRDPIAGELLLAIPAIRIDVAVFHAACADAYGNVQYNGTSYGDRAIWSAADVSIVQVERLVATEDVRRDPLRTILPGATSIVRVPFGAHPFASHGHYPPDADAIGEYVAAARALRSGDGAPIEQYLQRYVTGPDDHAAYLERVGIRRLMALSEY